jgi:competence protein ComEA
MGRKSTVVLGLLALGALVGGVAGLGRPTVEGFAPAPTTTSARATTIEVHVAGWVVRPGVVTLSETSIVADAIAAAGGLRAGAMPDLINLAEPVGPGDQVVVPGPEADSAAQSSPGDGPISLNRANAAALETLPGVGPVLAGRIVAFRDQNGPFEQVEDLLQVPGIGEAKLASIRDLVKVP